MAPIFTVKPSDQRVLLGQSAFFACAVSGDPAPKITWTMNGDALELTDRIHSVDNGLQILRVQRDDGGYYECIGSNEAGTYRARARLYVLSKWSLQNFAP